MAAGRRVTLVVKHYRIEFIGYTTQDHVTAAELAPPQRVLDRSGGRKPTKTFVSLIYKPAQNMLYFNH